jgi:hypothetical protein
VSTEFQGYTLIPYERLETLEDKLTALLHGDTLLLKGYESSSGRDVLVKLSEKRYMVTEISFDLFETEGNPRYWTIFDVTINDIELFTAFRFEEDLFLHPNKYMVEDNVVYESMDSKRDSAFVEAVYVSDYDPLHFAYKLSRDEGVLYEEQELKAFTYRAR